MKIHIVQKGDTLWEIAQKYSVDFNSLVQLNAHLANPEMIMPGMKIKIPADAKMIKKDVKKTEVQEEKAKKETPAQQPKKIEVPKLPKLSEEKAITLPILDEKEELYPTTMFPELPAEQKKQKYPEPKIEHDHQPCQQPEEQPAYQMPYQYPYQPQPQMMPAYYYPVMAPQQMGCGCCGQQMHIPYYPFPMYPRHYTPEDNPQTPPTNKINQTEQLYPTPPPSNKITSNQNNEN